MKNIILEVGANDGREINRLLSLYPKAIYYGFEPAIEMHSHLLNMFGQNPRVNLMPVAISNFNGFSMFNVAGCHDWGCSSLYEFPENILEIWPDHPGIKVTHRYPVPVMTMKTFLQSFIEVDDEDYDIEYLWIDAQGSDVTVLESFGDRIGKIKAGRIETASTVELYKNTNNQLANAEKFLSKNNFRYNIMHPPEKAFEVDVEFFRN